MTDQPSRLELLLLGPVELRLENRIIPVGGQKTRAVLALLGLAEGRVVSVDQLIDGIWGENPPTGVGNALQYHISILRKAFTAAGAGDRLQTRPPGYAIELETDATAFAVEQTAAREAARQGQPDVAVAGYEAALARWRGPALADLIDVPFAPAKAVALETARLVALEAVVDLELAAGHGQQWLVRLEDLLSEHPTRERFWAQLMTALYRSGQQAGALAAYGRARRTLDDELGVDPSPALQRLHAQVLAHDPALDAPAVRRPVTGTGRGISVLATRVVPVGGPTARLVLSDGRSTPITGQTTTIGRHPDCDLVLDDLDVSRRHLQVDALPGGEHQVVDLGSTNGSRLNGQPLLAPTILRPADQVELGSTTLRYERG